MRKNLWRVLALITGLLVGLTLTTVPANAASKVNTDRAGYHAWTQDSLSRCMSVDDNGNHTIAVPAAVSAAAHYATAPGYHRVGGVQLTGNGLPTVRLVANHRTKAYITLSNGVVQQTWRTKAIRRAWVPGYNGTSCSTWTLLEWAD